MSTSGAAQQQVAEHPLGSQVAVYYRPNDPSDAILRVGIGGADLLAAMFMVPFNVVMLVIWRGAGGSLGARAAKPAAGGAKVWDDGVCVRVRLALMQPLTAAAIAGGAASFLGVFVLGFGFGADPMMPLMLGAWAVILAVGACAYLYRQRKLAQGDCDLVIDNFSQTVALPRTLGRQAKVVVPMRKFISVEVERIAKSDSEGSHFYRYVPVALFTDEAGSTRRERIVEWSSQARAQGLAAWLRERLRIEPPVEPRL